MVSFYQFAVWDSEAKRMTFKLESETPIGLHRALVTLDDYKMEAEYYLYVFVNAIDNTAPVEEPTDDPGGDGDIPSDQPSDQLTDPDQTTPTEEEIKVV